MPENEGNNALNATNHYLHHHYGNRCITNTRPLQTSLLLYILRTPTPTEAKNQTNKPAVFDFRSGRVSSPYLYLSNIYSYLNIIQEGNMTAKKRSRKRNKKASAEVAAAQAEDAENRPSTPKTTTLRWRPFLLIKS